jgi:hypothetical protein
MPGADGHGDLMAGTALAFGGAARRAAWMTEVDAEQTAEAERALRDRRALQTLSRPDWGKLSDSGALLAQIGPLLNHLPADQGGSAAFAIASKYAQAGQWHLAREAFLLMVDRYPTHPLAVDAYRWLVAFHSSSEARRREELGQFLVLTTTDIHPTRSGRTSRRIAVDLPNRLRFSRRRSLVIRTGPANGTRERSPSSRGWPHSGRYTPTSRRSIFRCRPPAAGSATSIRRGNGIANFCPTERAARLTGVPTTTRGGPRRPPSCG